jgi:hypothetical protein
MNIEVTVSDVTLDSLIHESSEYENGGVSIGDRVASQIVHRLTSDRDVQYDRIRDRVREIRDEEIRDAVRPLIAEALSKPIQQANPYGEPVGSETTLTAIIVREAQEFMKRKAGDSYSRESRTVLQKMVADEVAAAFKTEVTEAVKSAREAVTAEIGKQAGDAIAAAVKARLDGK